MRRFTALIVLSTTLLASPISMSQAESLALPDLGDPARASLSEEAEARLGREIMRQVRASRDYVDDAVLTDYLNRLGERLVAASDEPWRRFEFFVVRDRTINAFALPGGYIGVHTGLISAARSEAELGGVLAHEIAHVTQHHIARMIKGNEGLSIAALAGLAVALLAAQSSPQLAEAALVTTQAFGVQQQIDYTRAHEQEADRVGLQTLRRAGFEPSGMASFFERLMGQGRLYENNAPVYLRTHPLSHERMADLQNRLQATSPGAGDSARLPGSLAAEPAGQAFALLRAQIQAEEGSAPVAVKRFRAAIVAQPREAALRYGLIVALLRDNQASHAVEELSRLRAQLQAPLVELLAARVRAAAQGPAQALPELAVAGQRWPGDRALGYQWIQLLLQAQDAAAARAVIVQRQRTWPDDGVLWRLLAEAEAALGHPLDSHLAQAEVYRREGLLHAAIEQLQSALNSPDPDFYKRSIAESRLNQLRADLKREQSAGAAATGK